MTDLRSHNLTVWKSDPFEVHSWNSINHSWPRESLHEFKIGVSPAGTGHFFYRGANFEIEAGQVLVLQDHEMRICSASGDWYYLYVDPDVIREIVKDVSGGSFEKVYIRDPVLNNPRFAEYLLDAHRALSSEGNQQEQQSIFAEGIKFLIQQYGESWSSSDCAKEENVAVKCVREILEEDPAEPVTLACLSGIVGLSPAYLNRVFAREIGVPPKEFQLQLRVRYAKTLLESGASAKDAALESGFSDQAHLTRFFKRFVGTTPVAYQQSLNR